jgi:histidinol dehydrogenase
MRIIRHTDRNYAAALAELDRTAMPDPAVRDTVAQIIADVREKGDAALIRYTEKFGGPKLTTQRLRVTESEIKAAQKVSTPEVNAALETSHANVLAFARKSLRKTWSTRNHEGALVGERFDPFQRVGIYVPGGTAPLVSSAIMTCTLAKAAGVPEIVVATPADISGRVNSALLHALTISGATEIYRIGGAQAVAALAFGTKIIRPVLKIFGPGNAYVVEAKRQVFGRVAVDLLPGPSEILILADRTAKAAWIAADLLAQAEHGHRSCAVFATDSAKLLAEVETEIQRQLATLARQEHLAKVIEEDVILVQVKSLREGVTLANDFAPEHLSIVARDDEKLAAQIHTAGAIFLGGESPVVAGDFVAGPSHELPTGGAGKSFPGLTAEQFQRRTSIVRFNAAALKRSLPAIRTFSKIEGLDAHGRSAEIRFEA